MKNHNSILEGKYIVLGIALLVVFSLVIGTGCRGKRGHAGSTTGSISGLVTSATGTVPLAGVAVSTSPDAGTTTTASDGTYSISLPAGSYTLTFTLTNYTTGTASANVAIGITTTVNVAMAEAASGAPTVTVSASGQNVGYGADVLVTASATDPNGDSLTYTWSGAVASSDTPTTATATTPNLATALSGTTAPASDPGGYVTPYVQEDRFGVLPISSDTRGTVTAKVTADDGHGRTTSASVSIYAAGFQPGIKAVAVGVPVYLNSGQDSSNTWTLTPPSGSTATLSATDVRNPFFVPDVTGTYTSVANPGTVTSESINDGQSSWRLAHFSVANAAGTAIGSMADKSLSFTGGNCAGLTEVASPVNMSNNRYYVDYYGGTITFKFPTGTSTSGCTVTYKYISSMDIYAGTWVGVIAGGGYVTQGTYTNWPTVTPDSGCTTCHNDSTAVDEFTPWKETPHANFFSRGLEGITSNSGSCVSCHTVGYDTAASAANDGYDDMASLEGFAYSKSVGAWAAMAASYPQTARRANIQCESCHGPQDTSGYPYTQSGAHDIGASPTGTASLRIGFGVEVCAPCHASGTGHHIVSEWGTKNPDTGFGHSNVTRAEDSGTSTSCARCHSGQGYTLYLDQLATNVTTTAGTANNIGSLPTGSIDWDRATVQPITCSACHDPHDATNSNQLRVYGSTPRLPSGFSVNGLGKGALCITCHNSRNAAQCISGLTTTKACSSSYSNATYLHEDGETYNSGNPTGYSAPHNAAQGDVLMGRNAYFMGAGSLPMISRHANVEDACAGCHMALNPQTHLSHGTPEVSGHVFYIRDSDKATVCANCHGSSVTGEGLVAWVEDMLESLGGTVSSSLEVTTGQIGQALISKTTGTILKVIAQEYVPSENEFDRTSGTSISPITVDLSSGNTIAAVAVKEIHGQIGFLIKLANPVSITWSDSATTKGSTESVSAFGVQLSVLTTQFGTMFYDMTGNMVRVGWNFFLIEHDNSKGIHNPGFVQGVLSATSSVVSSMTSSTLQNN